MISQQEIADRANITRASVGVHISNLMKKGEIVGKQYILRSNKYVCVIGGANIDIIGTPKAGLSKNDSSPGKISKSLGGVARNIAENLSKLDIKVELIDENTFKTKVFSPEEGFKYFCLRNIETVKILSPNNFKRKIIKIIKENM